MKGTERWHHADDKMKSEQIKREVRNGVLVMSLVFIWGILIMFVISAVTGKMWLWHLSWNIIPIIAFLSGLIYDSKMEVIPDRRPSKKGIWGELGEDKVTIIKQASSLVPKHYTGLH